MTFAESMLHLLLAAAISTALVGVGVVRGVRPLWIVAGAIGAAMTCFVADGELRGYRSDVSQPALIAAIVGGLAVGIAMILVGLRGRRVGDHPFCRRCGFDLVGRPNSTFVCTECGADLFAQHAVVIGVRHRRAGVMLLGVLALVLALAGTATFARDAVAWAERYHWRQYWPEAWLVADLRRTAGPARGEAEYELYHRMLRGTLGPRGAAALIDAAIKRPPGIWLDPMDATAGIHLARDRWLAGTIDEATVRRAMCATLDLQLAVAPMAAPGHVLRYQLTSPDPSLALATSLAIDARVDALDGRALPAPTASTLDPGTGVAQLGDAFALDAAAPLGPATLATRFTATITLAAPGRPTLVETRDLSLQAATRLVEPPFMTCLPVAPASPFAPRSSLAPRTDELSATLDRRGGGGGGAALRVANRSAVPILANARLVCGDVIRPLGPVYLHEGHDVDVSIDELPASPYRIEFVPAPELGTELFRIVPTCQTMTRILSSNVTMRR